MIHLRTPLAKARKLPAVLTLVLSLGLLKQSVARTDSHLRVLDRVLKSVLDRGVERSPTLRKLIAEIEAMRILVFAECAVRLPLGVGGRMNFVTNTNDYRFVRIAVDCMLTERWQTALLAHELQHALEIGRSPDVVDVESMESLYEEIGYPTSRDSRHFETAAQWPSSARSSANSTDVAHRMRARTSRLSSASFRAGTKLAGSTLSY